MFDVQSLSQFMDEPKTSHFIAAKGIVQYLKANPRLGLHFPAKKNLQTIAYCDSDWALVTSSEDQFMVSTSN